MRKSHAIKLDWLDYYIFNSKLFNKYRGEWLFFLVLSTHNIPQHQLQSDQESGGKFNITPLFGRIAGMRIGGRSFALCLQLVTLNMDLAEWYRALHKV
jgi:hypothetical protein